MKHIWKKALLLSACALTGAIAAPEGPSKPATAQELADWAEISDQAAAATVYQLKLMHADLVQGKFFFSPQAPFSHEEMQAAAQRAADLLGCSRSTLEAEFHFTPPLNRIQAARVLLDAMQRCGLSSL